MKPVIGVTAYRRTFPKTGWLYDVSYSQNALVVHQAGGLPVFVPDWLPEDDLRDLYMRLDGVLLPGGDDVDPVNYGAERHETVKRIDPERDIAEILLTKWAVEDDKPILGICRGCQVMNVALGGTLYQDIPSFFQTQNRHDIQPPDEPRSQLMHDVIIEPDTLLAQIMGDVRVRVNSIHHQCIQQPAPNVRVTAHADDGVIEGMEIPDKHFALAVQWHPEDITTDPRMKRLFQAFVEAARTHIGVR